MNPAPPFSSDLQNDTETVLDVRQSVFDFLWKRHPVHSFFVFVVPVCATIVIGYFEFSTVDLAVRGSGQAAALIALAPLVIPVVSYWRVKSRIEKLFYTELAAALDCSYSSDGATPTSGQLFAFGHSGRVTNVLSTTYKGVALRLADYTFTEGSGKTQQTYHYTMGELTVGGALPEVLCKPTNLSAPFLETWRPSGTEPLSLEGDFNSKFTVYAAEGQEIETLQILEPDVMAKLMDGFDEFGFECVDTHIYLFKPGSIAENRASVLALYSLIERFCDLLAPELHSVEQSATA